MTDIPGLIEKLVAANHILAHEGVVDGFGHVSVRHPDNPAHFFLSCSRSPELVQAGDIIEFDLDCEPVSPTELPLYIERPIHGSVFKARPDVQAVVHHHSYKVVPFSVSSTPLRAVGHTSARIGAHVPVWDIATEFGDTNLLVTTIGQGDDMAKTLADNRCVLMRGHGATVAGQTIEDAVITSIYLQVNAQLQLDAMKLGDVTYLSPGEIEIGVSEEGRSAGAARVWEYLCRRAGH